MAYRTLKELFESGSITGMESPRVIYNMDNVFRKYNIDQFRTGYNNFKQDFIPKNGKFIFFSTLFTSNYILTNPFYVMQIPKTMH